MGTYLEYAAQALSPHLKQGFDILENVQGRSTKLTARKAKLSYEQ